ncbi:piggyBac transposable element-derived protein 3 [Caerostris darwini]|uniref:PiggyBac transposable element-derived protein 3 n=1 Tax=Caerostris darwini TaxID=1538125 RepID=A0AAV4R6H9_9ARAC|nr:piggyBac transposable element-derived protein 3 [Caerostris darwini]
MVVTSSCSFTPIFMVGTFICEQRCATKMKVPHLSTLSGKNGLSAVERVRAKRSFDCHPGYFVCNGTKICVEQRFICDDYKDCEDGSDEWNCSECELLNGLFTTGLYIPRPTRCTKLTNTFFFRPISSFY